MSKLLKKYENLEKNFNEIKNITGTAELTKIIDEILNKNKNYQLKMNEVYKNQKLIKELDNDIIKLNKKVNNIFEKYGVITDKETLNIKRDLDDEEKNLEKKEKELIEKYDELQKIYQNVNLIFENVKYNINKLYDDMMEWAKKENKDNIYKINLNSNEENKYDMLKEKFENFTYNTEKKLNILFLCHSKQEFINVIRQKGKKINLQMDDNFKRIFNKIKLEKPKLKKQKSDVMIITTNSNIYNKNNQQTKSTKEKETQDLIFHSFLKEYKQEKYKEIGVINKKQ